MIRFEARPDDVGKRSDVVLARRADVPRSVAARALAEGTVTLAGVVVRPGRKVTLGDVFQGDVAPALSSAPGAETVPLAIRYEDDRVLVVSKPAGMVTHPAGGHSSGTLVNALLGLGIPLAHADGPRPGIVHRLDRGTSGLLLVAKDDDAHASLVEAMKKRVIQRSYQALVRGVPTPERGTVDAPLGRHPVRRRSVAVIPDGAPAVTHFALQAQAEGLALLRVDLETGRTHQIRVHLAHIGHPVLGDKTYGGWTQDCVALGLERPFLHADRLTFPSPAGADPVTVSEDLPADLWGVLEAVGMTRPS